MELSLETRRLIRQVRSDHVKSVVISTDSLGRRKTIGDGTTNERIKLRRNAAQKAGRVEQHGTSNEYSNYGCRCAPCRKAKREEMERKYLVKCLTPDCENEVWNHTNKSGYCRKCSNAMKRQHGTENCYRNGCRNPLCVKAATKARKIRRTRGKVSNKSDLTQTF